VVLLTLFLFLAGILLILYGCAVAALASGTRFFLVWFALGGMGILAAFFRFSHLWERICAPVRIAAGAITALCLAVLAACVILIGTRFAVKGEEDLPYVIVLGAQVREDGPSKVLRYRLDTACAYLKDHTGTRCIVSGGQGYNEPFSEAEGMRRYLEAAGIGPERIILEENSVNTAQNMEYSLEKVRQDAMAYADGAGGEPEDIRVGIVTNNFHMYRALAIAHKKGLEGAVGIAAGSDVWYLPNNVLRECLGILKDKICGNM